MSHPTKIALVLAIFCFLAREISSHDEFDSLVDGLNQNSGLRQLIKRAAPTDKRLVCHYANVAAHRASFGMMSPDMIDANLCTHIIYGIFGINTNYAIDSMSPMTDFDGTPAHKNLLAKTLQLKAKNPNLKILLSVAELQLSKVNFSEIAEAPTRRATFIASVMDTLQKFKFDGVDLDWQFSTYGVRAQDKANYAQLLRELKTALASKNLLLSLQVSGARPIVEANYDVPSLVKEADMISVQAYDHYKERPKYTEILAPLYGSPKYKDDPENTVNWTINYWLASGAPASKINLGLTFNGATYTLDNEAQAHGIHAPASKPGLEGPFTLTPGLIGFNELCAGLKDNSRQKSTWKLVHDTDYHATYAQNGPLWVSFECKNSVARKTEFALSKGLGGIMVHSLDVDDFSGKCYDLKFPLTNSVKRTLAKASTA